MIFDNEIVTQLYKEYLESEDSYLLDQVHQETSALIEVIALSVNKDHFDDLVQEAHLKLYMILTKQQFDPAKGTTMHSFLSSVLKNCMLDYIRKDNNRTHDRLEGASVRVNGNYVKPKIPVCEYAIKRFPSLHNSVAANAAEYVAFGVVEASVGKSRGVSRTLETLYPLNRTQAYIFYNSILVYLRLYSLDVITTEKEEVALELLPDREYTLIPEVILASNCKCLLSALEGVYVKF